MIGVLAHDWDAAFNAIERAVSINPSSSAAYHHGAFLYALNGQSVIGATYARRALRLSPFYPLAYHAHMALTFAAIQEERYDEAAAHGAKLAQVSPNFGWHVMIYAVALALGAAWRRRGGYVRGRSKSSLHGASAQLGQLEALLRLPRNARQGFDCWACPNDDPSAVTAPAIAKKSITSCSASALSRNKSPTEWPFSTQRGRSVDGRGDAG